MIHKPIKIIKMWDIDIIIISKLSKTLNEWMC